MKQVGVVLSGCGVYDGTEIHEAVLTLLALDRAGAQAVCFAPDKPQLHAAFVQHLAGAGAPGVLPVVITQPAAEQKDRTAQVGIDVVKEDVQKLDHFGPPEPTSTYCGATSWLKRRW